MNDTTDSRLPFQGPAVVIPKCLLEAIVSNGALPARERFDALLLLTSFGNGSGFACHAPAAIFKDEARSGPFGTQYRRPLSQNDFAEILQVPRQRVTEIVRQRRKQGLMKPPQKGRRLLEPSLYDGHEKAAGA
jgi:hypothetical protein